MLEECLRSLAAQTFQHLEVIVVDNSGKGLARQWSASFPGVRVLENPSNAGFGAAVNQGFWASEAPYLATLNDDVNAWPDWLEALVKAAESNPDAGMFASQIRLAGRHMLDSAGMVICPDGSSKQRGHLRPPEEFSSAEEVLLPSACAALYRRQMLEAIGGFDEDFFLYSEDTDLGLRARWAGWKCLYVPGAVVEHRYSHSAGRASPLKAYYVERNRLFLIMKNFPAGCLALAPLFTLERYGWHLVSIVRGRGLGAEFCNQGGSIFRLLWIVIKAHFAMIWNWPALIQKRSAVRQTARLSPAQFRQLLRTYGISTKEVAAL